MTKVLDLNKLYERIINIDKSQRELIISSDIATKSNQLLVKQARAIVRRRIPEITGRDDFEMLQDSLSDDLMNLIEIACSSPDGVLFGVKFLNRHCYVPDLSDDEQPLIRRSVEL